MIDVKDAFFPKKAKELLSNLSTKRMTMSEFLSECAYWGLQYLDQYRLKPMPSKPNEVAEYCDRVKQNASYEAKSEFWRVPHIAAYVESARKIDGENRGNMGKLQMILDGLPQEDKISRDKVMRYLNEFRSEYGVDTQEKIPQMSMEEIETEFFGDNTAL